MAAAEFEAMTPDQRGKALLEAAYDGNLANVNILLGMGTNVNFKLSGFTPLYKALTNGRREVVDVLLAAGADVNIRYVGEYGNTLLHMAVQEEILGDVNKLLAAGANLELTNNKRETPLLIATERGNLEIVERLLAAGANKDAIDNNRQTPLFIAALEGNTAIVERLLAADANVEAANIARQTPLFAAAWKGHTAVVERLLEEGANKDATNVKQVTPLLIAASEGHTAIVERLLAAGANIEAADTARQTPLFAAAWKGHTAIAERLLAAGANKDATNENQATPLFMAASQGHTAIVERLLAAGANRDATNVNQATPLFMAASQGHTAIVERLLAAGANVNKRNNAGKTAKQIAAENGHAEIVKLLSDVPEQKWKGFSRSDLELMNTIFETEPSVVGGRPPCENWSCCPVCLVYVERQDGCMYMNHNCTTTGRPYHRELYEKYKVRDGYWKGMIAWCTLCGRICQQTPHRHYSLSPAKGPTATVINIEADPYGNEPGCIAAGGGGLREKILRYRRIREYALELNSEIDKITLAEAFEQLVEEAWNAPFARKRVINNIRREKKWNTAVSNELFPSSAAAAAALPAPDVPWPFQGRPAMMPLIEPAAEGNTNVISMEDIPIAIQLRHRKENGEIVLNEKIGIHTLFGDAYGEYAGSGKAAFGRCFFEGCSAILYPGELQYILDHYDHPESLSAEQRAEYQTKINKYKERFNDAYRDNAAFKARVDADIAAAATMPAGGAGAAAGQGGGSRRRRTRRFKRQPRRQSRYRKY